MQDKIKEFLESGRLEEYVFGTLDEQSQLEVEKYIEQYPVVKNEYQVLQNQLETVSVQLSKKAPVGMKSQILESLPAKNQSSSISEISLPIYLAILGVAASLFLAWAWYNSHSQLQQEKENYNVLASECEVREKQIESQNQLIAFLNSEQTQRYDMQGNQLAPDFKAMVFVNEVIGKAILKPHEEIALPKNKCLQLWGDLDGEMIPIAVLGDLGEKDYDLKIDPNFTSLNFTIEEKTDDGRGQLHPDVSQLIASVVI